MSWLASVLGSDGEEDDEEESGLVDNMLFFWGVKDGGIVRVDKAGEEVCGRVVERQVKLLAKDDLFEKVEFCCCSRGGGSGGGRWGREQRKAVCTGCVVAADECLLVVDRWVACL